MKLSDKFKLTDAERDRAGQRGYLLALFGGEPDDAYIEQRIKDTASALTASLDQG